MTLEESREVIPMMETMINQIEEQQNLMAEMVQELQERDRQLLSFQEQNQSLKSLNSELRFHFTDQDLKQSSDCLFVSTNKSYFVIMTECERNVIQNFHTVDGLGKVLHHKDFVTDLAVWTEIDIWVFTAGRTHIVKLDLFQGTLTGSRLFGLGSVWSG